MKGLYSDVGDPGRLVEINRRYQWLYWQNTELRNYFALTESMGTRIVAA